MNLKRIQDLHGEKAKQKARNLADRRKLQDERENFTKERQYFHKEILPFLYPHKVEVGEMKWRNRSNATLAQELGTRLLDDPRKCEMGSQMSVPHAMSTLELGGPNKSESLISQTTARLRPLLAYHVHRRSSSTREAHFPFLGDFFLAAFAAAFFFTAFLAGFAFGAAFLAADFFLAAGAAGDAGAAAAEIGRIFTATSTPFFLATSKLTLLGGFKPDVSSSHSYAIRRSLSSLRMNPGSPEVHFSSIWPVGIIMPPSCEVFSMLPKSREITWFAQRYYIWKRVNATY